MTEFLIGDWRYVAYAHTSIIKPSVSTTPNIPSPVANDSKPTKCHTFPQTTAYVPPLPTTSSCSSPVMRATSNGTHFSPFGWFRQLISCLSKLILLPPTPSPLFSTPLRFPPREHRYYLAPTPTPTLKSNLPPSHTLADTRLPQQQHKDINQHQPECPSRRVLKLRMIRVCMLLYLSWRLCLFLVCFVCFEMLEGVLPALGVLGSGLGCFVFLSCSAVMRDMFLCVCAY